MSTTVPNWIPEYVLIEVFQEAQKVWLFVAMSDVKEVATELGAKYPQGSRMPINRLRRELKTLLNDRYAATGKQINAS